MELINFEVYIHGKVSPSSILSLGTSPHSTCGPKATIEVRLDSWLHMAIPQPAQYYQNKRTSSQLSICKEQATLSLTSLYIRSHVFSCLLPHILWLDITPRSLFEIVGCWLFIKIKLFSTHVTYITQLFSTQWHSKHFFHLLWVKSKSYYNIFPKIFPHL